MHGNLVALVQSHLKSSRRLRTSYQEESSGLVKMVGLIRPCQNLQIVSPSALLILSDIGSAGYGIVSGTCYRPFLGLGPTQN
jgi:hypothetical protein